MITKIKIIISLLYLTPYVAVGIESISNPSFTSHSKPKLVPTSRGGPSLKKHHSSTIRDSSSSHAEDLPASSEFKVMRLDEILPTEFIAEANLPTDIGHFRIRAYRVKKKMASPFVGTEPCVIYATENPPGKCGAGGKTNNVPVRIHDQCFTSEVLRSQRCDCKDQLVMAFKQILKHGGAIIYLQQEGRGIGIANKVAAYALQDTGLDTVDANIHLGFPEDARIYGMIPSILEDLGIESVKLMTNNPLKVEIIRKLGVNVEDTIPMVVKEVNQWNRKYLETKVERMRHNNFDGLGSVDQSFILPTLHNNSMMAPKMDKQKDEKSDSSTPNV